MKGELRDDRDRVGEDDGDPAPRFRSAMGREQEDGELRDLVRKAAEILARQDHPEGLSPEHLEREIKYRRPFLLAILRPLLEGKREAERAEAAESEVARPEEALERTDKAQEYQQARIEELKEEVESRGSRILDLKAELKDVEQHLKARLASANARVEELMATVRAIEDLSFVGSKIETLARAAIDSALPEARETEPKR